MKVSVVLGTRPEIIKMSPLIRELEKRDVDFNVVHSGQHYDDEVSGIFFRQLELDEPDRYLSVGSGSQGEQTGRALMKLEKAFQELGTEIVLVQGDTNTVLAGALAGVKMGLTVGHVEAGLRSYDYRMPEEYNRRLADHSSHLLFAPTEECSETLKNESVWGDIHITGNTVIDACIQNMDIAEKNADLSFEVPEKFVLVTAHRAENVDDPNVQENFIETFRAMDIPMIYPIHPRAEERFKMNDNLKRLKDIENMKLVPPQGYLEFLLLMKESEFIITDSGGIQEEATAPNIRKKVLVLRESTERPEAVEAGYCTVVGTKKEKMIKEIEDLKKEAWSPDKSPYGNGKAAEKIVDILERYKQEPYEASSHM